MNFEDLKKKHEIIQDFVTAVGDAETMIMSDFLGSRIGSPDSYVTLLGETSSGKSTLLNGLLKQSILHTSAAPTTGTIIEIEFDDSVEGIEYYAIYRDAAIEELSQAQFLNLSDRPSDDIARLLVAMPTKSDLRGLRLFDTPGFGSIVEKHEEILKEFIPNSDAIVYVIGYKIGIQENDFSFMRYVRELVDENTDVVIAVNRCPVNLSPNDRRMAEIRQYSADIFHKQVPIFTIPTTNSEDGYPLPQAQELWAHINSVINSTERRQMLVKALDGYLNDLYQRANKIVESNELARLASVKEKEDAQACAAEFRANGQRIIDEEIIPTFKRLIADIPRLMTKAKDDIYHDICADIDAQGQGRMEETKMYINVHSMPFASEQAVNEYRRRLYIELDALNERIDDYLNEAIQIYDRKIEVCFGSNLERVTQSYAKSLAGDAISNGLTQYFKAFGGRAGAGRGVANAAKHWLKNVGKVVGKKFSRETYRMVDVVLKKIGATSAKSIAVFAAVVVEAITVIYEYSTWKSKLKKQVGKALDDWYQEIIVDIAADLEKLMEQNKVTLREIIEEKAAIYEIADMPIDHEKADKLLAARADTVKRLEEAKL